MSPAPNRSIGRELSALAWPIIGLNVLNVLALAVDTAMCGRLPDADTALVALGFATQVIFLLMVAMFGLVVGTVAMVARSYGAGQRDRVDHVLLQATQLTVMVGLLVAVVGNLLAPQILRWLGAQEASLPAALSYLRPLLTLAPFTYLNLLYAGILRGVGNTRLPFLIALGSNGLNVLVNYGLILGHWGMPALGVQGAAIGTATAQAAAALTMMAMLASGSVGGLRLKLRPAPFDLVLARTLGRIGWPAALDMVVLNAAFLSIVGMLGRIDELAVAAHGVGLRVQALAFVPGMSVSQATGALVGQALGARDPARARAVLRASIKLSVLIMSVPAVLFIAADQAILAIFDVAPGTPLSAYTVQWIAILGWGMPIVGVHIAFVGLLQGAGATMTSLRINLWTTLACQIPLSWLLGFPLGLGTWGVWAAFPMAFALKAVLDVVAYRRGGWARLGAEV